MKNEASCSMRDVVIWAKAYMVKDWGGTVRMQENLLEASI